MLDDRCLAVRKAASLTGFAAADFSRIRSADLGRFTLDRLMKILDALDASARSTSDLGTATCRTQVQQERAATLDMTSIFAVGPRPIAAVTRLPFQTISSAGNPTIPLAVSPRSQPPGPLLRASTRASALAPVAHGVNAPGLAGMGRASPVNIAITEPTGVGLVLGLTRIISTGSLGHRPSQFQPEKAPSIGVSRKLCGAVPLGRAQSTLTETPTFAVRSRPARRQVPKVAP